MFGKTFGIGAGIVAALLVAAIAIPTFAVGSVEQPAFQKALSARSDALNREYGLGRYARPATRATAPGWMQGLIVRSDALNRRYGLGEYARKPAGATAPTPAWLQALLVRSDALNRMYGLGKYANGS